MACQQGAEVGLALNELQYIILHLDSNTTSEQALSEKELLVLYAKQPMEIIGDQLKSPLESKYYSNIYEVNVDHYRTNAISIQVHCLIF